MKKNYLMFLLIGAKSDQLVNNSVITNSPEELQKEQQKKSSLDLKTILSQFTNEEKSQLSVLKASEEKLPTLKASEEKLPTLKASEERLPTLKASEELQVKINNLLPKLTAVEAQLPNLNQYQSNFDKLVLKEGMLAKVVKKNLDKKTKKFQKNMRALQSDVHFFVKFRKPFLSTNELRIEKRDYTRKLKKLIRNYKTVISDWSLSNVVPDEYKNFIKITAKPIRNDLKSIKVSNRKSGSNLGKRSEKKSEKKSKTSKTLNRSLWFA